MPKDNLALQTARKPLLVPDLMRNSGSPNRDAIIAELGSNRQEPADLPSDVRFAIVCFTNRCGSAYFGDLLNSTGVFRQPLESLNADEALPICQNRGLKTFQAYFAYLVARNRKAGFYTVKAAPEQLELLTDTGILDDIIDRTVFLFINRANKLGQAISRVIAEQNKRWAWHAAPATPDSALEFAAQQIANHVEHISIQNQCFEQFFGLNGIEPVNVGYEQLVEAPQAEMDRIARRIGIPSLQIDFGKLKYRRQANEINDEWRSRFLAAPPPLMLKRAAAPASPVPKPVLLTGATVAHVQNVGDVGGDLAGWIGQPGGGSWLEGFSIGPREGLQPGELQYCGFHNRQHLLPWTAGGGYCGTRGLSVPLRGFCIRLADSAAGRFECSYAATFTDGSKVGPLPAGQLCYTGTLAPLEAIRVAITTVPG